MGMNVYVQIRGVAQPAKIDADKVEDKDAQNEIRHRLIIFKQDAKVGEFKGAIVDGWWCQSDIE
jgi:hypothetical protein